MDDLVANGLMSLREVSIVLSRSENSLRADIIAGRMKGTRIGKGSYRVARAEVQRILVAAGALSPTDASIPRMEA